MGASSRTAVFNGSDRHLTVLVEPLAEDYTLEPSETIFFELLGDGYFLFQPASIELVILSVEGNATGAVAFDCAGNRVPVGYNRASAPMSVKGSSGA